jgi:hypothetical protein
MGSCFINKIKNKQNMKSQSHLADWFVQILIKQISFVVKFDS